MKNNDDYLKEAAKISQQVISDSKVSIDAVNKIIPQLKEQLKTKDPEGYNLISELQGAMDSMDFVKLNELKAKLNAYKK